MDDQLVVGDKASKIRVTCKDSAGQIIDLSGKSAKLRYKIDGGTLQSRDMTVTAPLAGLAEYQVGATDVTPGLLVGEVRLNEGLADQLTSSHVFAIAVRAPLS